MGKAYIKYYYSVVLDKGRGKLKKLRSSSHKIGKKSTSVWKAIVASHC